MALPSPSASPGDMRFMQSLRGDAAGALPTRGAVTADPKSAIRQAAKQFEALFMQQLMKSMRESTMSTGMLENGGTQLGTEMLDTQYASQMTGMRGGLSDLIARQLERQSGVAASAPQAAVPAAGAAGAPSRSDAGVSTTQRQTEFLRQHQESAKAAEAETGIPATFMVAQAAHESGWGKHEIRNADGSSAHNLFGIKAGANWTGAVTQVTTTEVVNGQPRKVVASFRAYESDEASFRDYAKLMKENPRYAKVMTASNTADGFAQGLQRAGYATDPAYADKLTRVINTTLRLQRAMA